MVCVRLVKMINFCLILSENVYWIGKLCYGNEEKVVTSARVDVSTYITPDILTHCGPVTQICVFTLQLCKMDDANLRF